MTHCQRCLYPSSHPLGITFDGEGICSGCRVHEEKDRLDWNDREKSLVRILEAYRTKTGRAHDCIIPVSGARDSYFIVHTIKNRYKLNPLLVTYNKHYNTRVGIRNLAYLRTLFGCDCLTLTVSPQTVKRVTRATLETMGSMYWHCLAGQTVFPVQIAVKFKIPLIVWGVHQGCDQVGMFSHLDEVEMTRRYRKDHDLMGFEAEDLLRLHPDLKENDLSPYFYPHDKILERVGVRGIYLGNYIRWDSKKQHEDMIRLYGYETFAQERTFDAYNDVDCVHYSSLHDALKQMKWGYGKALDHACREIRLKRLTREEAVRLVQAYSRKPLNEDNLRVFLEWMGMDRQAFFSRVEKFRGRGVVQDGAFGGTGGVESARLEKKEDCRFELTPLREPAAEEGRYTLLARGHVELRADLSARHAGAVHS